MSKSTKTLAEKQAELREKMAVTLPAARARAIRRTMKATGALAQLRAANDARHLAALEQRAERLEAVLATRGLENWEDRWTPEAFAAQREFAASRQRRSRRSRSAHMERKHLDFVTAVADGSYGADDAAYERWLNGETPPSGGDE